MTQTLEQAAGEWVNSLGDGTYGILDAFKAGAEWQQKEFSSILDKWEEHAIRGMKVGASAYHQGKIALICDLRDWIKEIEKEVANENT